MSIRNTKFAAALLGGALLEFLSPSSALAQRTLVDTATTIGAQTLQEVRTAVSQGAPVVTGNNAASGCSVTPTGCGPQGTPKGHGGLNLSSIAKGVGFHMLGSCIFNTVTNGEASLTLVGSLLLEKFSAEGCFKFFERVKKVSVKSGLHSLEIYCSREHGKPGMKEDDTDYYGIRSSVMVSGQILEGDFEQMKREAKALGYTIHDAGNVQDVAQGWKNIYIEMPIETAAVFTPAEIKEVEADLVADLEKQKIKVMPHKLSTMKTVYSFNGYTGATYDDERKIGQTRALAIKTDRDAAFEMGSRLGSVVNRVLEAAEARYGKVCVGFHSDTGRRYTMRASAKDTGGGTCYGTITGLKGEVIRLMGRYIPDYAKALAAKSAHDVRPGG